VTKSTAAASAAPALTARWRLLAILTASYGAGAFGMLGISPLSPSLVEGLGLTRFQVAFLVPSIYLAGLLFSLPGGRLADRLGVRPAFLGGLAVGAIGLVAAALAPSFLAFLFCLFVAGTGWSVVNPALGKAIMDVFPVQERGIAMGVKQMGLTLGGLVAALALPAIAAVLGWRYAIGACSVIVAVPVALGWRPLAAFRTGARGAPVTAGATDLGSSWWWARRPALVIFFGGATALFALAFSLAGVGWVAYLALALGTAQLGWQVVTLRSDEPANCLARFRSNRFYGWILFGGLLIDAWIRAEPLVGKAGGALALVAGG
jgi:MFS family permease